MIPRLARRYGWAVIIVVGAVIVALIAGRPPGSQPALSPTSTAPDGTKALVLLLGEIGGQVDVGPTTPAGSGTALVLSDQLNNDDRNALLAWASAGHTLVIADPASPMAQVAVDGSNADAFVFDGGRTDLSPGCQLAPLGLIGAIQPGGGQLLKPQGPQVGCFNSGGGYFVVAAAAGAGTVVVLGGPSIWTNANLDRADNSVLAAALLVPAKGTEVTVVGKSKIGGGHTGLLGLIPPRSWELFWQLVFAFFVLVLWRARRLGRPVPEANPVEVPGSEIVLATGHLLQEGGHRARAADLLRGELRRRVSNRLGIPSHVDDEILAETAAQRAGLREDVLVDVLTGPVPSSDNALVNLAQTIQSIEEELSRAR